jgi:hypothetical protein
MSTKLLKGSVVKSKTLVALRGNWFAHDFWKRLTVTMCDDCGRFEADPELMRAACYPYELDYVTVEQVGEALERLESLDGFVVTYVGANGKPYGAFVNWTEHQRVRHVKPRYPAPPAEVMQGGRSEDGEKGPGVGDRGSGTEEEKAAAAALSGRVKAVVTWFYQNRRKATGTESSEFDGSHVHPADRNAALKYFRMLDLGKWEREDFGRRVTKALRHEYTKNVPRTFAGAVLCFDDYLPVHEKRGAVGGGECEIPEVRPRGRNDE